MGPGLRARGLRKRFRGTVAVDGVDLDVRAGERVALLGPNGAGKATTLLMILGAITPDEGEVEIAGRRLPHRRSRAMESVGFAAGYLPRRDRLRAAAARAIDDGLARFRIPHLAEQMCTELSGSARSWAW